MLRLTIDRSRFDPRMLEKNVAMRACYCDEVLRRGRFSELIMVFGVEALVLCRLDRNYQGRARHERE
jgi:hypothetical protein